MSEDKKATTKMMRGKMVIGKAKMMAAAIILRLKEGKMFDAFGRAGDHFLSQEERRVHERLYVLRTGVIYDPDNEDLLKRYEEAEEKLMTEDDFTAAADRGDQL